MVDFFEAVSYPWGDQEGCMSITKQVFYQDGTHLQISENCGAMLRRIRRKSKFKTLWIDTISIDQENLSERNHQIELADLIYRQAQLVLVDLGLRDKRSQCPSSLHIFGQWAAQSIDGREIRHVGSSRIFPFRKIGMVIPRAILLSLHAGSN